MQIVLYSESCDYSFSLTFEYRRCIVQRPMEIPESAYCFGKLEDDVRQPLFWLKARKPPER